MVNQRSASAHIVLEGQWEYLYLLPNSQVRWPNTTMSLNAYWSWQLDKIVKKSVKISINITSALTHINSIITWVFPTSLNVISPVHYVKTTTNGGQALSMYSNNTETMTTLCTNTARPDCDQCTVVISLNMRTAAARRCRTDGRWLVIWWLREGDRIKLCITMTH